MSLRQSLSSDDARAAVLAEARTWLGTPFHDHASVKGIGVDCAMLVRACYEAAGVISPLTVGHYSPQWFLHHRHGLFEAYVTGAGGREIPLETAQPGDLLLYKDHDWKTFGHGAIVVSWPTTVIHAWMQAGCVTESGPRDGKLSDCEIRAFTLW